MCMTDRKPIREILTWLSSMLELIQADAAEIMEERSFNVFPFINAFIILQPHHILESVVHHCGVK